MLNYSNQPKGSFSMFTLLYKLVSLIIAGILLITPLSRPVIVPPENPVTSQSSNPFMATYGNTQISAHRLGKGNAPENTLMAVKECLNSENYHTDYFEMDIQITKDGELVVYHSLYLDEKSDSAEYFGKKNTTVFSKTYDELRNLNMGEYFSKGGKYPYQGLRGKDIPEDMKITKVSDILDYIEENSPGKYMYTIEIKYPHPWAPKMVDKLYTILKERNLTDRVIVASFWPDVHKYIKDNYSDKLLRSADPIEILNLYNSYLKNEDLSKSDISYCVLQIPYYEDDGRMLVGNLGKSDFIAYAHKYNIAVQYWTVNDAQDMLDLKTAGADAVMSDHPDRVYSSFQKSAINS